MKRLLFVCIASAMLFAGCSGNQNQGSCGDSETGTTTTTSEQTESAVATTQNNTQDETSHTTDATSQKELPIMSSDDTTSDADVTVSAEPKTEQTVTNAVSTSTNDDVIKLPFVPAE